MLGGCAELTSIPKLRKSEQTSHTKVSYTTFANSHWPSKHMRLLIDTVQLTDKRITAIKLVMNN